MPAATTKAKPKNSQDGLPDQMAMIPTKQLHESPLNPRKHYDKAKLSELVASIEAVGPDGKQIGVLQNLVVRELAGGKFEVVCGHRRLRAAKIAGLDSLRCMVRQLTDPQALEIMLMENMRREDLHWLEESAALEALAGLGWTTVDIGKHFDKSASWVASRKSLHNLTQHWRKAIEDPDLAVSKWPFGVIETIARYSKEVQDAIYDEIDQDYGIESLDSYDWPDVARIRDIASKLLRTLDDAGWDMADETLAPKAGSCNNCSLRASCRRELFSELKLSDGAGKVPKGDTCLSPECFDNKRKLYVKQSYAKAKQNNPGLVLISQNPAPLACSDANEYTACKESAKGAERVYSAENGKVYWATTAKVPQKSSGSIGSSNAGSGKIAKPQSATERVNALIGRRNAHVCQAVQEMLDGNAERPRTEACSIGNMCAFAATFGTAYRHDHGAGIFGKSFAVGGDNCKDPWGKLDELGADNLDQKRVEELADALWYQLRPVLLGRLTFYETSQVDPQTIARACWMLGANLSELRAKAEQEIKVPRSWGKAELAELDKKNAKNDGEYALPATARGYSKLTVVRDADVINIVSADDWPQVFRRLAPPAVKSLTRGRYYDAINQNGPCLVKIVETSPEETAISIELYADDGKALKCNTFDWAEVQDHYRDFEPIAIQPDEIAARVATIMTPQSKRQALVEIAEKLAKAPKQSKSANRGGGRDGVKAKGSKRK